MHYSSSYLLVYKWGNRILILLHLDGLLYFACNQTRYIFSCFPRLTWSRRSTMLSCSTKPHSVNSVRISSESEDKRNKIFYESMKNGHVFLENVANLAQKSTPMFHHRAHKNCLSNTCHSWIEVELNRTVHNHGKVSDHLVSNIWNSFVERVAF